MDIARKIAIGMVALVVGLFALIGALHTFRGTPVSEVEMIGGDPGRLSVADPLFRETVEALSGVELQSGHRAEILHDGEIYPRLWHDLRGARRSITLRLYFMLPGTLQDSLRVVLSERARAGIPTLLLYDAFGSEFKEGYRESLRAAGVQVRAFRPLRWYTLNRAQNRSHVRGVVIDGEVGYTGGFGIADQWRGDGRRPGQWRETNVRFEGPAVARLQAAFAAGWAEATGELLSGPLFFPATAFDSDGALRAGLLYASPTMGSTEAERFLALSIAGARRTLYITNAYFVPDDDLRRLLIAAARRGVDVRVLTAGRHTDQRTVRLAGRARYEDLLRGGVRVYEYQPSMVHAKTLVADGVWGTVGTMNFDNRSAALNEESNLVVFDPEFGARLQAIFMEDIRYAREIRLELFRRRPWTQRVQERVAVLFSRLL